MRDGCHGSFSRQSSQVLAGRGSSRWCPDPGVTQGCLLGLESPLCLPVPSHGHSVPCLVPELLFVQCGVTRAAFRPHFCAVLLHICNNLCHILPSLCALQVWRNSWSHLYLSLRGDKDQASVFKAGLHQDCVLPPGAAGDHQWGRNGQANICVPWALQCSQVSAAPPFTIPSSTSLKQCPVGVLGAVTLSAVAALLSSPLLVAVVFAAHCCASVLAVPVLVSVKSLEWFRLQCLML